MLRESPLPLPLEWGATYSPRRHDFWQQIHHPAGHALGLVLQEPRYKEVSQLGEDVKVFWEKLLARKLKHTLRELLHGRPVQCMTRGAA